MLYYTAYTYIGYEQNTRASLLVTQEQHWQEKLAKVPVWLQHVPLPDSIKMPLGWALATRHSLVSIVFFTNKTPHSTY
jgi:hypothetical protein